MKEIGENFTKKNVVLDYFSDDHDNLLLESNMSTDKSYKAFLEKFESFLDT